MKTCLVTVLPLDRGIYQEWRGCTEDVRALFTKERGRDADTIAATSSFEELMRTVEVWACSEKDVDKVVEYMSKEWVGHEIKVFNMTQAFTRQAGDLKAKKVTTDGVFPE